MGLNSKTSMHTDISSNKMACLKQNTDIIVFSNEASTMTKTIDKITLPF